MKPKSLATLCCTGFLALAASTAEAQTVLSEWTFNNDSKAFSGFQYSQPTLGAFSTTAASYGERYINGNQNGNSSDGAMLLSNTAGVFSGPNVNFNFTGYYVNGSYDANNQTGGYGNDAAFGAGYDGPPSAAQTSAVYTASSNGAGSLLLSGGQGSGLNVNLTTTGYTNLTLSFQVASINGNPGGGPNDGHVGSTIQLGYIIPGGGAVSLGNALTIPETSGSPAAFSTMTVALPTALENLATFDLTIQANQNGQSMIEIDNFMLTAAPEPSTWAMLGLGGVVLLGLARHRRATRV